MADLPPLLGEDPAFLALLDQVSALAPLDRPALVIGERGTGKELIAARLHFLSARWDRPFVKVNCAALAPDLLESELFGHEAGAFTGATRRHIGRFERAHGGTLFLDEIANASLRVQEQILRVVEYGEFERVGGGETRAVDVRLIGATNVDLPAAVAAGSFRADLLDRLAFDVLTLPPLRARPRDIPLLAQHFAQGMAHALDRGDLPIFGAQAMAALLAYSWPGNVRELRNVVERAVYRATGDGPIERIDFDPFASPYRPLPSDAGQAAAPATPSLPFDFRAEIAATEKAWLLAALTAQGWHQGRTAQALGLGYDQLRHLLKKHGLQAPAAIAET
ncbi:psp operon transcriptional activator [Dongia mobilis]|uniref:Psp operon transcriptional activator n=1 Tax=Dongia mobilis TaxID=578943 RepID=A0A4R6WTM0_9PROT|nr:phage shock protein operon transcriptional activator [Dongia mobilis]TDQ82454.1 psp operon transcriptional activator [Dongia mobilis]